MMSRTKEEQRIYNKIYYNNMSDELKTKRRKENLDRLHNIKQNDPEKYNKIKENIRLYQKENYDSIKANKTYSDKARYTQLIRTAKERGYSVDISFEQYILLSSIHICHYCYGKIERKLGHGLDRKDNSKGYFIDNVVRCCKECNRIKQDILTYEEMVVVSNALRVFRETGKTSQPLRSRKKKSLPKEQLTLL